MVPSSTIRRRLRRGHHPAPAGRRRGFTVQPCCGGDGPGLFVGVDRPDELGRVGEGRIVGGRPWSRVTERDSLAAGQAVGSAWTSQ